jgi:hypothetical protein
VNPANHDLAVGLDDHRPRVVSTLVLKIGDDAARADGAGEPSHRLRDEDDVIARTGRSDRNLRIGVEPGALVRRRKVGRDRLVPRLDEERNDAMPVPARTTRARKKKERCHRRAIFVHVQERRVDGHPGQLPERRLLLGGMRSAVRDPGWTNERRRDVFRLVGQLRVFGVFGVFGVFRIERLVGRCDERWLRDDERRLRRRGAVSVERVVGIIGQLGHLRHLGRLGLFGIERVVGIVG